MKTWTNHLEINPIDRMLNTRDLYLKYRVERDLLDIKSDIPKPSKELIQLTKKQQDNGSWLYKNKKSIEKYPSINHHLIETYRSLRLLVDKYELKRDNDTVANAAEYVFSCQTTEGDIRGILGNQYMPYYCGAIVYLLIKAGYGYDVRTEKALQWLKNTKQSDGGWVIPLQASNKDAYSDDTYKVKTVRVDVDAPSSHLATGMVLRAFAIHPEYKRTVTAMNAARLLKKRMLKPDKYNDRKSPEFWLKFQYPYWFNTLISSLDTLQQLGFKKEDEDIQRGIEWLLLNQNDMGLWGKHPINAKHELDALWIAYDICRLLKCYLG